MNLKEKLEKNDNVYININSDMYMEEFKESVGYYAYIEPIIIEISKHIVLVSSGEQAEIMMEIKTGKKKGNIISIGVLNGEKLEMIMNTLGYEE